MDNERNPADFIVAPEAARGLEQTQIGKFHTKGGHGFAAEEANALADRMRGKSVDAVGTNNAVDGADRIVDGLAIQTKYHQEPRLTIGDAFDSKTGLYRYQGQMLEVPKDQYDECVQLMRERIATGKVPGISDPNAAEQIVKQGEVTYKQARNIARAGNIDSILFDAKSQTVASTYAFAIGFAIHFARCKWNGTSTPESIRSGIASGFTAGGTSFVTGIVSAQMLRTRAAAFHVTVRGGVRVIASTSVGRKAVDGLAHASLGKAVYGAAAVNRVAKLLRTNMITSAVVFVATATPDFYRALVVKSISWQQFMKNGAINIAAIGVGTGGWLAGSALGAAAGSVVPGVGTALGSIVGGLVGAVGAGAAASHVAKEALDHLVEDDAKRMVAVLQEALVQLAEDHILSEPEIEQLLGRVKTVTNETWLSSMYQAGVGSPCPERDSLLFAYRAFDETCLEIAKVREKVTLPRSEEVQALLDELVARAHQDLGATDPRREVDIPHAINHKEP